MKKRIILLLLLSILSLTACTSIKEEKKIEVPYQEELTLTNIYPHNTSSFTEGLFVEKGILYESIGKYGESYILQNIQLETGIEENRKKLEDTIFAEGSTMLKDKIYLLTYKEKKGYRLNPNTLEMEEEIPYEREGWGLTTDGEYLIASDGSSSIYFLDENLEEVRTITVRLEGQPIQNLNELEYIDGELWMNVWRTNQILIVNPENGTVRKIVNFDELVLENLDKKKIDVMNGIAYDSNTKKIYITGKYWPTLYEFERKGE